MAMSGAMIETLRSMFPSVDQQTLQQVFKEQSYDMHHTIDFLLKCTSQTCGNKPVHADSLHAARRGAQVDPAVSQQRQNSCASAALCTSTQHPGYGRAASSSTPHDAVTQGFPAGRIAARSMPPPSPFSLAPFRPSSAAASCGDIWQPTFCSFSGNAIGSASVFSSAPSTAHPVLFTSKPQPAACGAVVLGRWSLQMFAVLEQLHAARVFLKLCSSRGAALVRIRLVSPAQRLLYRCKIPVYAEMQLRHMQRLGVIGCGCLGKIAALMSHGAGGPDHRIRPQMIDLILRWVAARRGAATPEALRLHARSLWVAGQHSAAAKQIPAALTSLRVMHWSVRVREKAVLERTPWQTPASGTGSAAEESRRFR